jgi:adenylate kinase family enzyme
MQRVCIIGTSGSGKTTLARQIAEHLSIPHVELDALHWRSDWTPAAKDTLMASVAEALAGDAWVVDGNYSMVRHITWASADTIIWLDYSLPVVVWRISSRTVRRLVARTELWNGNRERLRAVFSRDSIILWALTSWGTNRRRYRQQLAQPDYTNPRFVHLHSPRQTRLWLQRLVAVPSVPVH